MKDYEQARLYALRQLNLLDTPPSESFDRITRMASQFFNLPIAAVSLTDEDRQWFKSRVGVEHREIPRLNACCGEVANSSGVVVVPDLLASPGYQDSYLAKTGIRFYAGAPLLTREGYTLGAMCVLGTEPRDITDSEIGVLQDLAALVMAQIELQHAFGRIDSLTGLPNRSQFAEDLEDMARDEPGAHRLALVTEVADVSELGTLHRVMGPSYLDEFAGAMAQHLRRSLSEDVTLYHLSPWRYLQLVHSPDTGFVASEEASRIRSVLLAFNARSSNAVMADPVVGMAPFQLGEASPEDVLRMAHSACQDARQEGTGVGTYSVSLDAGYRRRFTLLNDFRAALEANDQLRLVYQPRVTLASGNWEGAEALLRWRHPTLGEVSPAEFIPLLENSPLARPLTDWVIRNAVAQAGAWRRKGLNLCISVNISATNLEEDDFAERLLARLDNEALPRAAIELELTESALISNNEAARAQLEVIMGAGVKLAIDDFGTGYSTLSYLQQIPAHTVKIDRSFITRLATDQRGKTLVKSMINMAHDLGYSVVAEGVETEEAYQLLALLGCDEIQGYLVAKPLPVDVFEVRLDQKTSGRVKNSARANTLNQQAGSTTP